MGIKKTKPSISNEASSTKYLLISTRHISKSALFFRLCETSHFSSDTITPDYLLSFYKQYLTLSPEETSGITELPHLIPYIPTRIQQAYLDTVPVHQLAFEYLPLYLSGERDFKEDFYLFAPRLTGVIEGHFEGCGFEVSVVAVGGRRSERRKWLHVFENEVVLLLLDVSGFYRGLYEDDTVFVIREEFELFKGFVEAEQMKFCPVHCLVIGLSGYEKGRREGFRISDIVEGFPVEGDVFDLEREKVALVEYLSSLVPEEDAGRVDFNFCDVSGDNFDETRNLFKDLVASDKKKYNLS
eukprot:TRINITY_DN759_c0_g4_i1.p1 TRINITY_DN759_c0_g4~~TRINITY_DN759_c0_g4_i1.p1  ORF type:complete len:298 (+),score=59.52 TRINITY_DN759_c0_g4_i1:537-1430(+)